MAKDTIRTGFAGTLKVQAELRQLIDCVTALEEKVSRAETHVQRHSARLDPAP